MTENKKIIIFLLLLSILPRVISLVTFDFIDSGGGSDSVTYILLARNLFTGLGYTEFGLPHTVHHPFYPIMIGLVWKLVGDLALSAKLVSCISGILLVIPVYFFSSSIFGRRTGILAGMMTALSPILVYGSTESFSEPLYTLLLIMGLTAGWLSFKAGRFYQSIFSGIFLGLSFLTHPLGITFLPLVAGFNLLAGRRRSWLKERIPAAILITVAFCLISFPFWLYLHSVTENWQISGSSHYQDFGIRYDQSRGAAESEVIFYHMEKLFEQKPSADPNHKPISMAELIIFHPDRFLRIIGFNLRDGYHEAVKTAHYLALPLTVFFSLLATGLLILFTSFLFAFIRRRQRPAICYLVLMFTPLSVFLIMQIEHRYFFPFIPLALIAFARIVDGSWKFCKRSATLHKIFLFVLVVYYLSLSVASGFIIYRKALKTGIPYEYKILGNWMKENIPGVDEEKVMMFRLGISYYAGCDWNVFYWGDFPGLKNYLRKRDIKYLVVDSYKLHMIHPDLRFLLTADPLPPDFSLMRELKFDGRMIRLLEFHPKREGNR